MKYVQVNASALKHLHSVGLCILFLCNLVPLPNGVQQSALGLQRCFELFIHMSNMCNVNPYRSSYADEFTHAGSLLIS